MIPSVFLCLLLQSPPLSESLPASEASLDSVRIELNRGRPWHASRRLWARFPDGPGEDLELLGLFLRAEAGWKNWSGVRGLLDDAAVRERPELADHLYFRGRALEEEGGLAEKAVAAYTSYLRMAGGREVSREEVLVRRALLLGDLGRYPEALEDVKSLTASDVGLGSWVALRLGWKAAEEGRRAESRMALSAVERDDVRGQGWEILPRALLLSGDSTGAEAAYWSALPSLRSSPDRAMAWARVGDLRMARGDSAGAKGAFHQVLQEEGHNAHGATAAAALLTLGFDSVAVARAAAAALTGAGRHDDALRAWAEYEALRSEPLPPEALLARARVYLASGQAGKALASAAELGDAAEAGIAAAGLILEIRALGRLGRRGEARAVQDELMDRFPEHPESVEILFLRADAAQDRGDRNGAIRGYQATVALAPALNRAGEARMRMGQLFLGMERTPEALAVYSDYLEEFPDGRRWDQAAYWAGRLLLDSGRREDGRRLLENLRASQPLSYYSVLASELLGKPFAPDIQEIQDSLPFPTFLREGLRTIDLLRQSGLAGEANREADALAARIRLDPDDARRWGTLLRLALELNGRGFTREGINLGWELRREGRPWDRNLLRAVYPLPYLEILHAEASERGVDPFLLAGLIRQESAFWAEARSRADARGLMQVLPSTGRALARRQGPDGFRADDHLYEAEINIHLGAAFFVDMRRRFGKDLPIILSAYNAGPTRATRWRNYPEFADMPRFVERIPFPETRGYVKNVTANWAIYSWLYGSGPEETRNGEGGRPPLP